MGQVLSKVSLTRICSQRTRNHVQGVPRLPICFDSSPYPTSVFFWQEDVACSVKSRSRGSASKILETTRRGGFSASDADILTYGRAKGLFAGVSLGGATVEPDNDANDRLYGKTLTATDIVRGTDLKSSDEGKALVALLDCKITKHSN